MKRSTRNIRHINNLRIANQSWARLMELRLDRHAAIEQLRSAFSYSTVRLPE